MSTSAKVRMYSSIFYGVLGCICIFTCVLLNLVPDALTFLVLVVGSLISAICGAVLGQLYLPAKNGNYVYTPFQAVLIITTCSVVSTLLVLSVSIMFYGDAPFLEVIDYVLISLIGAFFITAVVLVLAAPVGMYFGAVLRARIASW